MHADMQTEERSGLPALCPDMGRADQAFKRWIATEEGARLWQAICTGLSPERLCNALAQAQAKRFGLMLTHHGAIIWSRFSQKAYIRLAALYEEAAQTGLCFWWDDGAFIMVGGEAFLERITTLPEPQAGTGAALSPASSSQGTDG